MEKTSKESRNELKKRPQRRADLEIYRPGALRHRQQTADAPSSKTRVEENGKKRCIPSSSNNNFSGDGRMSYSSICASSDFNPVSNNTNETYSSTRNYCQRKNGSSPVAPKEVKGSKKLEKSNPTTGQSEKTNRSSQLTDILHHSRDIKSRDFRKEGNITRRNFRDQTIYSKSNLNENCQENSKPKGIEKLSNLNCEAHSPSNEEGVTSAVAMKSMSEDEKRKGRGKNSNAHDFKRSMLDGELKRNCKIVDNFKNNPKPNCTPSLKVDADVNLSTNSAVSVQNVDGDSELRIRVSSSSSEAPKVNYGLNISEPSKQLAGVASTSKLSSNPRSKQTPLKNTQACSSKPNLIDKSQSMLGQERTKSIKSEPPTNDICLDFSNNGKLLGNKKNSCEMIDEKSQLSAPGNILKENNANIPLVAKHFSEVSIHSPQSEHKEVACSEESQTLKQRNFDEAEIIISKNCEEINKEDKIKESNRSDWAEESYLESKKEKSRAQPCTSSPGKNILPYEQNLAQFLSRRQQELQSTSQVLMPESGFDPRTGACNTAVSPSKGLVPLAKPHILTNSNPVSVPKCKTVSGDFGLMEEPVTISGYEELLHNIHKGECDIQYYVNSNQIPREFPRIMDIRVYLQSCYMKLFSGNIALCHQKNLEAQMWKTLYYNIIEKLREYATHIPELQQKSISTLLMLVQEGHNFLQSIVRAIESRYGVSVADVASRGDGEEWRGRAKMALGVAQRLLLDLGDLARYRLQYCGPGHAGANSALPYRWYQLASRLYPRNGRPFHQLAILSVTQKRPLDVFYFYVRSLMAANPFVSAKDSLTSFFDGIRTRFTVLKEELDCRPPSPRAPDQVVRQGALHREVWYRLDGSNATKLRTCALPTAQAALHDPVTKLVDTLPSDQLMKQFLTCFLHCHGLLFSRVSLEEFDTCCRRCLLLFAALLQCTPSRLSGTHLLQVLALNMFAVRSTQLHDTSLGQGYRSAAQELALLLSLEMFGRLAQHVASVLPQSVNTNPNASPDVSATASDHLTVSSPADTRTSLEVSPGPRSLRPSSTSSDPSSGPRVSRSRTNSSCEHLDVSPRRAHESEAPTSDPFDVVGMTWLLDEAEEPAPRPEQKPRLLLPAATHLVPALKVWCDWLLYNSSSWHPPPSNTDYTSQWFDSWSSVAELATILHGIGEADVSIFTMADVTTTDRSAEFVPLVLDEDKFLRGYDPLLPAHNLPPMLTDDPTAVARACDWVRLQQLQTVLGKFLCGLEPPVLRLQKTLQGDVLLPAISSPSSSPPPEGHFAVAPESGSARKPDDKEDSGDDEDSSEEESEQLEENALSGDDSMANNINATLRMLWQRKRQMDKLKKRLEREKERKSQSVGVELEVRPRYVVPDTNCFITHLQYLTSLVAQPSPYTLLVPLVVVRELEGLSRGGECPVSLEEAGEVVEGVPRSEWARLARDFVRSRKHNIKAVTTQGNILASSDFQEAIMDEMSNDDRILSSCQHFCLPDATRSTSGGGVLHVKCEAVLLTADRNLAIKAYAANVPVCSVLYFRRWAEQSSSGSKYEGNDRSGSRGRNPRGGGGGNPKGGSGGNPRGGDGGNHRGGRSGDSRGGGSGNPKSGGSGNPRNGGRGNPRGGGSGNPRGRSSGNTRGGSGNPRGGGSGNPRGGGSGNSKSSGIGNPRGRDSVSQMSDRLETLENSPEAWNGNSSDRFYGSLKSGTSMDRENTRSNAGGVHRSNSNLKSSWDFSVCEGSSCGKLDLHCCDGRSNRRMVRTNSFNWDLNPLENSCSRRRSSSVGKNHMNDVKYREPLRVSSVASGELNSVSKSDQLEDQTCRTRNFEFSRIKKERRSKPTPKSVDCGVEQSNTTLDKKYICSECCELIHCSTHPKNCLMCSKQPKQFSELSDSVGYSFCFQNQCVDTKQCQCNDEQSDCFYDPPCSKTFVRTSKLCPRRLKLDLETSLSDFRGTTSKVDANNNNNLLSFKEPVS